MLRTRLKIVHIGLRIGLGLCLPAPAAVEDSAAGKILDSMLQAVQRVRTLRFHLQDEERIPGESKLRVGDERVTLAVDPLQLYVKVNAPRRGVEILWVTGKFGGKALVHPNGFPYFTLKLDPFGSILWTGHHTLFEVQPAYFAGIIADARRAGEFRASTAGVDTLDGRPCDRVVLVDSSFGYTLYRVPQDETVMGIAKKLEVSESMILEKNPGLKAFTHLQSGREITVPTGYGLKTEVCVDRATELPVIETVYDEAGLYEKFEYHDLQANPPLTSEDFSENNPAYKFR